MTKKERLLAALKRNETDRVPYVEGSIGLGISQQLLHRKLSLVEIPQLGRKIRSVEDEKALSRLLQRDHIAFRFTAPTFSEDLAGYGNQAFAGDGLIKNMDDFRETFSLPDPEDESLYTPIAEFIKGNSVPDYANPENILALARAMRECG